MFDLLTVISSQYLKSEYGFIPTRKIIVVSFNYPVFNIIQDY